MRVVQVSLILVAMVVPGSSQQQTRGYYRFPAIHGHQIGFTTHPGEETRAAFSPDGQTIAFSANYEGPTEVYTMPAAGGLPRRRTFEGNANVVGWTPDGKILYATRRYSTLPD